MNQIAMIWDPKLDYLMPTIHNNGQTPYEKGKHQLPDADLRKWMHAEFTDISVWSANLPVLKAVLDAFLIRRFRITPWIW